MKGFVDDIEKITLANTYFRYVVFTAPHSQLVVMCLAPGEEIGIEVHTENDQFLRIEKGTGKAVIDGEVSEIHDGFAIIIPAGSMHNIINSSSGEMKLYTIYSPPHHPDSTTHKTKAEALKVESHH
ncbi:cupin domain-containing protein [Candidatus Microgenomates bacterium]|nr:MAG: cupin domain-containing protein [Candidatus Microgenomates bacterium]